jgi:hypothetical protein
VPSLAVRFFAGSVAAAEAEVLFAPAGTSTAKLPVTEPDDGAPASAWRFSTHAWTSTSTVLVMETRLSVPNAGSNALIVEVPGASRVTCALTCWSIVSAAADPTPTTNIRAAATNPATESLRPVRASPHAVTPVGRKASPPRLCRRPDRTKKTQKRARRVLWRPSLAMAVGDSSSSACGG